jgi:23S rRNA (uracil1939-C5)-methyltransferase
MPRAAEAGQRHADAVARADRQHGRAKETCPQIELACGDDSSRAGAAAPGAAVARATWRPPARFCGAEHSGVQWWLQPRGPDTVKLLDEGGTPLAYRLPEFGVTMPFKPTDFTQVNPHINRVLVGKRAAPAGRAAATSV